MERIVAIIQARMGSSRLPGKVLMNIEGKPTLKRICERLESVPSLGQIVVATSVEVRDDEIETFCKQNNVAYFRGSESDVLDRFYKTAKASKADVVIRITADCPLVDPLLVQSLVEKFQSSHLDYCAVATGAGVSQLESFGKFPDGLDAEIMRFSALEDAWKNAQSSLEREHVTPFIWKNTSKFKTDRLNSEGAYGDCRWTLDTKNDFDFISAVYRELKKDIFGMSDVLNLLHAKPQLAELNRSQLGKEGYNQFWE